MYEHRSFYLAFILSHLSHFPVNLQVSQVHRNLPDGGILVFMTGQAEILDLCRRLREEFSVTKSKAAGVKPARPRKTEDDEGDMDLDADEDEARAHEMQALHVLPLYSTLPAAEQAKVGNMQSGAAI